MKFFTLNLTLRTQEEFYGNATLDQLDLLTLLSTALA